MAFFPENEDWTLWESILLTWWDKRLGEERFNEVKLQTNWLRKSKVKCMTKKISVAIGELVVNKNITAKNRVDRRLSQANFFFIYVSFS